MDDKIKFNKLLQNSIKSKYEYLCNYYCKLNLINFEIYDELEKDPYFIFIKGLYYFKKGNDNCEKIIKYHKLSLKYFKSITDEFFIKNNYPKLYFFIG